MNPVLILTHNCLSLTKKCVASVLAQDIPVELLVYDNGSSDGTSEWLPDNTGKDGKEPNFHAFRSEGNTGVSFGWNWGINYFFNMRGARQVLVANNDTVLPPWTYRRLLDYDAPFVTGAEVYSMEEAMAPSDPSPLTPGPDFSLFLIRKDAWERVGPFDEAMKNYYSDNDWHVRAHHAGVPLMNSHVKFYHERSSTIKYAMPDDEEEIRRQYDLDKAAFIATYGCDTSGQEYQELFK